MLKVMIAEDDLMMADMLEDVLVEGGYEVCGIARTVEKGVELGERHQPDLAVLDLRLAGGGLGTEIATRLNRRGQLGVLYATGNIGHLRSDQGGWRSMPGQAVPTRRCYSGTEDRGGDRQHRRSLKTISEELLRAEAAASER